MRHFHWILQVRCDDHIFTTSAFPLLFRDCVFSLAVCPVIWALCGSATSHHSRYDGFPQSLAMCGRLLALLVGVGAASIPGLEQLWAWRSRDNLLCAVAPAVSQQCLICGLPVHLLSPPASAAHGLLLWQDPAHHQRGEWNNETGLTTLTFLTPKLWQNIRYWRLVYYLLILQNTVLTLSNVLTMGYGYQGKIISFCDLQSYVCRMFLTTSFNMAQPITF